MVRVSVTEGLYRLGAAHKYAAMLAEFLSKGTQYWCFGSDGGFERSYEAMAANIKKIHLKLDGDPPWPPGCSLSQRTCDNYLVYAKHLYNDEHYQLLAIISPNAHSRIDSMLPAIIRLVEDTFSEISEEELGRLKTYNA
ncbi:toxin [Flyfo siphovirus Tbat2_3]|nr:toxin [Flyfo siphovirus Tbat2_3]